jgi:hypothetical protein
MTSLQTKALLRTIRLVHNGTLSPEELIDLGRFIKIGQATIRLMFQTTLLMDAYRVDVLEMLR